MKDSFLYHCSAFVDQVFFFMQPVVQPPWHPAFHWRLNDTFDSLARTGFQSVLYIKGDVSNLEKSITLEDINEINRLIKNQTSGRKIEPKNVSIILNTVSLDHVALGWLYAEYT